LLAPSAVKVGTRPPIALPYLNLYGMDSSNLRGADLCLETMMMNIVNLK
jgi:hypothetical protein